MHDKFKKKHRAPKGDDRLRRQIAREAARRMCALLVPEDGASGLKDASEADYYSAKRKAAAVLGHAVRPGDLPSDAEVRDEILSLARDRSAADFSDEPEPAPGGPPRMADHLDRFAIYKMRLEPLAAVKQNPKWHPEGDALYHSLQVFEKARAVRPYDEEFLLAALLHDVGKAIDPHDHVKAGMVALEGTLTPRTAWLIAHHMDLVVLPDRPLSPKVKAEIEASENHDDLVLLRDCDESGREVGAQVATVEEALAYLRGLESEFD
jgi:HD domain